MIRFRASLHCWKCMLLCLAMSCLGCHNIVWLPDSSGFVYVNARNGKTELVRVAPDSTPITFPKSDGNVTTVLPAISPDGKQLVQAQAGKVADKLSIGFEFFALDAKPIKKTKLFPIPSEPLEEIKKRGVYIGEDEESPPDPLLIASLIWSPGSKYLLFDIHREISYVATGIYDIERDEVQWLKEHVFSLQSSQRIVPIMLPDGSGFVAYVEQKPELKSSAPLPDRKCPFTLFDWKGKAKTFTMDSKELELFLKNCAMTVQDHAPKSPRGKWEMGKATIEFGAGILELDPTALTATFREDDAVKKRYEISLREKIRMRHPFPTGKLELRTRSPADKSGADSSAKAALNGDECDIELFQISTGKAYRLAKNVKFVTFSASPDGKYLAITYSPSESMEEPSIPARIIVFDQEGKIVFEKELKL